MTHEIWGQDIESAVQSIWMQLDRLSLADPAELKPHTQGLLEVRDRIEAALSKALEKRAA